MLAMTSVRRASAHQRSESAQDSTYHWLKTHIAALPRSEGTFLTEHEIATAAGTSRTPVREALLRLETEGLVQIVPKKGAFVPPISEGDVADVMEARHLVEDWSVRRLTSAHKSLTPELSALVDDLNSLIAEQEEVVEDAVAFIDLDRVFHRTIVEATGNTVLAAFYESLRDRQVRMGMQAVATSKDRSRRVLGEHQAIVRALRSRNTDRVAAAVRTHLDNTLGVLRNAPRTRSSPTREGA